MGSAYAHWAGFQGLVARVCLFHCSLSASGLYYLEEFLVSFFFGNTNVIRLFSKAVFSLFNTVP